MRPRPVTSAELYLLQGDGRGPSRFSSGWAFFAHDMRDTPCNGMDKKAVKYIWDSKRKGRKVHILLESGGTACKAENGMSMRKMDMRGEVIPSGRDLCFMCRTLMANELPERQIIAPVQPRKLSERPAVGSLQWNRWVQSKEFIHSWEWRTLRYQVLKKRTPTCECCGASPKHGARVSVDHIKPRSKYPELAMEETNLQVLCSACNQGKGRWDETDWRQDGADSLEELDSDAAEHIRGLN